MYSLDFFFLIPELFFLNSILYILCWAIFYFKRLYRFLFPNIIYIINFSSILLLILLFVLLYLQLNLTYFNFVILFNFKLLLSNNLLVFKLILVFIISLYLLLGTYVFKNESIYIFEFIILILFSLFGFFLFISAYDFLILYFSIELYSLCFYILTIFKKNKKYNVEAGLKYFILGSLSSCLFLFGISLVYAYTGILNFYELSLFLNSTGTVLELKEGILIGFFIIIFGFFFKLGVAPLHIWLIEVYSNTSLYIMFLFVIISKLPVIIMLIRFFYFIFLDYFYFSSFIIVIFSCLSFFFGIIGALYQTKIKRFLAYTSISHLGFILLPLSTGSFEGFFSSILYIIIYICLNINLFFILFYLRYNKNLNKMYFLTEICNISLNQFVLALIFSLTLFSMAGIPPLMGFYSKYFVLMALINSDFIFMSFFMVIISVISAVYYLNIIKYIFFLKGTRYKQFFIISLSGFSNLINLFIISLFFILNLIFFVFFNIIFDILEVVILSSFL